jgi:hypothetical protein
MSTESERKKRVYEETRHNAAIAVSEPVEDLPIFNTEQLTKEATDALVKNFSCYSATCDHIEESLQNPDSDFYGYFEKVEVRHEDEIVVYVLAKSCAACATKDTANNTTVARIAYSLLSDHTIKAMLKNQGTERKMVPRSTYGKKLATEAAAEGPDSIN